jgi:hypothetical protein
MSYRRFVSISASVLSLVLASSHVAHANDGWDPFNQLDPKPAAKKKQPAADPSHAPTQPPGAYPAPGTPAAGSGSPNAVAIVREQLPEAVPENSRGVERGDLTPVIASDGSGLPHELWRGLDVAGLEGVIAKLDIPPRSPAVHSLWQRLVTSNVTPPDGAANDGRFDALRAEALYRSGRLDDAAALAGRDPATLTANPTLALVAARLEIGRGEAEKGCELAKSLVPLRSSLPKPLQGEALVISGLCAAIGGNSAGAGLAAELAREDKSADAVSIAILDAIASGQKAQLPAQGPISLLTYRLAERAGGMDTKASLERGEPALLTMLASLKSEDPALQLAAGEASARLNAMSPATLADLYRTLGATQTPEALMTTPVAKVDPAAHRAALFKAAEAEKTPLKKVRLIRATLDDAKRAGLYWPMLIALAPSADTLLPVPEIGWFSETGVEIGLASGNLGRARQWGALATAAPATSTGEVTSRHWFALIDLVDPVPSPEKERNLDSLGALAARGRLSPDLLQKLATVLDAIDTNVPIALWEAASKAPQTQGGFLPETGVLSELQDAAKKKEFGRTVLLVMRSLGRNGPEGANTLALGDSIRALRRAGLEVDARRMGLEALFAQWPRSVGN